MPRNQMEVRIVEPGTLVRARVMEGFPKYWQCGRCGQEIRLSYGYGWRFDDGTWRPTAYHLRQRRRAEARLQDPTLSAVDRARERDRLRSNNFHQARERPLPPPGGLARDEDLSRGSGTHRFPQNYAECPRCHVINALNPVTLTYRLLEAGME